MEVPLVFAGTQFKYKLYGKIYNGGLFVDNIRLYKEETASISTSKPQGNHENVADIFSLDGSFVGRYEKVGIDLPYGIYIVRQNGHKYKIKKDH